MAATRPMSGSCQGWKHSTSASITSRWPLLGSSSVHVSKDVQHTVTAPTPKLRLWAAAATSRRSCCRPASD